jgi:NTE family protein
MPLRVRPREPIDLVLSGGASHIVAIAGAALELDEHRCDVVRVAGSSAGAAVAAAIAFGITRRKIVSLLMRMLEGNTLLDSQVLPFFGWGWYKGEVLRQALRSVFGEMTMGEAHLHLKVVVCDVYTRRPVVIDSKNPDHADLLVVDALYASMAIPFFFRPGKLGGVFGNRLFVDGGTAMNFAMHVWDDVPERRTVGVRVDPGSDNSERPTRKVSEYVAAIAELVLWAASNAHISKKLWADVITVPAIGSGLDFALTPGLFSERFSGGIDAVKRWVRNE